MGTDLHDTAAIQNTHVRILVDIRVGYYDRTLMRRRPTVAIDPFNVTVDINRFGCTAIESNVRAIEEYVTAYSVINTKTFVATIFDMFVYLRVVNGNGRI